VHERDGAPKALPSNKKLRDCENGGQILSMSNQAIMVQNNGRWSPAECKSLAKCVIVQPALSAQEGQRWAACEKETRKGCGAKKGAS
jgi:hypothetical protein